jgi:hypothetical protein
MGCEREGARTETYTVALRDPDSKDHTCDLDQAKWASMTDGSRWTADVHALTHSVDCSTLRAP